MYDFLTALGNFSKEKLDGISLDDRKGESRFPEFNLFIGQIYGHAMEPRKEEFPFILVRLLEATDEDIGDCSEYSLAQVRIVVGVWNDGLEAQGYHDLLNCLTRLANELFDNPILEKKYEFTGKMTVATFEDNAQPFWFGDIVCQWQIRRKTYNPLKLMKG